MGRGKGARYRLTEKGLSLLPMMVEMIVWSARHDPDTAAPEAWVARAIEDREALIGEIEAELRGDGAVAD